MIRLVPLLLVILYAVAMWQISVWRLRRELDARSTPLAHPRLDGMLARLAQAMDLPSIRAHVFEVPQINGLAAPDGRVFLTRGFVDQLDRGEVSEAELASVIAHELGHVAYGHARRRMLDFAGGNVVRVVLAGVAGRFIPVIGPWLAGLAAAVLAARLSQGDEYEADAFAAALMTRARLGTEPQKALLSRLDRMAAGAGGGAPEWLRSHPSGARRIAAIEALEARWRG